MKDKVVVHKYKLDILGRITSDGMSHHNLNGIEDLTLVGIKWLLRECLHSRGKPQPARPTHQIGYASVRFSCFQLRNVSIQTLIGCSH